MFGSRYRFCSSIVVFVLCMAGAVAQPPAAPAEPLTVEEAVAFALRNNPTVTVATQDVRIAEVAVASARAEGRPTVTVASTSTYNPSPASITIPGSGGGPDRTINLSDSFSSGIQVTGSQPVWPPSRWRAPVNAAQAQVGAQGTTLSRTRQQIAYQVRQAYYQLLSARQLQEVADDAVRVAEGQLTLAKNTFEAGTAPRLDVVQATAALESARVDQLRAQNGSDLAAAALAVQLGLPAGAEVRLAPQATLPPAPEAIDPLVQAALAQRTELTELNFRRTQLRANMELIKLQSRPIANVQVNYGDALIGSGGLSGSQSLTLALSVAMAVYNGGKTKADLEGARLQLEQLDTRARQVELGITLEVRQAVLNLQNALAQLTAAQRQLDAANEALDIAQVRYDFGEGIFLEVEQARLRQTQARTALTQARFQANLADAQLAYALGTPVVPPATPTTPAPAPAAGQ
ncbi:MAG: Outer membrane efflux protein BepC precursor [bacterium ADurb.Bin429]|nr:MAG: Outer membrane efflux protein BepC precursor [bacterium ADurb.Bin429]